jgi:hypothetical protein
MNMVLKTSGPVTGQEIYSLADGLKISQGLCRIKTPYMCTNLEYGRLKDE